MHVLLPLEARSNVTDKRTTQGLEGALSSLICCQHMKATIPMHYNVAKADVLNFQRAAYQHMVKAQVCCEFAKFNHNPHRAQATRKEHIEMFATTKRALRALLSKGMSEDCARAPVIAALRPHKLPNGFCPVVLEIFVAAPH
eukprot:6248111-Amphidinium_carterae.1